jgi:hypothetical protein
MSDNTPHRERPSDMPYKVMRWIDVYERLKPKLWVAINYLLGLLGVFVFGFAVKSCHETEMENRAKLQGWRDLRERCSIHCHPHGWAARLQDECWCLPDGEPAYISDMSKGAKP